LQVAVLLFFIEYVKDAQVQQTHVIERLWNIGWNNHIRSFLWYNRRYMVKCNDIVRINVI